MCNPRLHKDRLAGTEGSPPYGVDVDAMCEGYERVYRSLVGEHALATQLDR